VTRFHLTAVCSALGLGGVGTMMTSAITDNTPGTIVGLWMILGAVWLLIGLMESNGR